MPLKRVIQLLLVTMIFCACKNKSVALNEKEYQSLMNDLARAWSSQNTDLALRYFHSDAIYMQPPNIQYFRGHAQLRPYFGELTEKHKMKFHQLWFDEAAQIGVGEFTFSYGVESADTGIVVVELENGTIKFWREYVQKGPADFEEYLNTDHKEWQWHIENYPESDLVNSMTSGGPNTSFKPTLEKHLNAVSNRDLVSLKSTLSPKGDMSLILPGTEMKSSTDEFIEFHMAFFKVPNWTFETRILETKVGSKFGTAIVEAMYREPDRNGKPYYNRMMVSYVLEKINGKWYVIKDHASSIEKSTDPE
ncbi:MAG: nuclear transport factor 2 family protein [Bacteroidota bacterium]